MTSVYSDIAKHFSETRYKPWPGVVQWLQTLPSDSHVLDLGCGNGKYLSVRSDLKIFGCDACPELVEIAKSKHPHARLSVADGCALPYATASMDAVFSIAVFHHLDTVERRKQFLKEVLRVLKPGAPFFLTVWSPSAVRTTWIPTAPGDYLVPWHDKYKQTVLERYYHIFELPEIKTQLNEMFEILKIYEECQNWYIECRTPLL